MISECPHCQKGLQFNEAQQEKLTSALANLKSGTLKLGCPHCKKPIEIAPNGSLVGEKEDIVSTSPPATPKDSLPAPPVHPDMSWLATGMYDDQEVVEDVSKVLILMPEGEGRDAVSKAYSDLGFQARYPESGADAISQMRFVTFSAVVLHEDFEGTLAESVFHKYMKALPMSSRRYIYYVLVGKSFHTLYDLEALTNSANVVVNDVEISHFETILKKGMHDYDELFAPYIEALASL